MTETECKYEPKDDYVEFKCVFTGWVLGLLTAIAIIWIALHIGL